MKGQHAAKFNTHDETKKNERKKECAKAPKKTDTKYMNTPQKKRQHSKKIVAFLPNVEIVC